MTTKHTPAQIDVEPHAQGEIPDTGTYAGELYMLATPKRIRACNMHDELVAFVSAIARRDMDSHAALNFIIERARELDSKARGEA